MDLKNSYDNPLLTRDRAGNLLLFTGKNKDVKAPLLIYDVISGSERGESPQHLINQLPANKDDTTEIVIPVNISREPNEAIVVLFDVSTSMTEFIVNAEGLNRLGAVKAFF